ncbi:chromosome segregation protein [Roseovarius albus]|uniref:Chromosome segregation protein n=1 Tax=Roseovarius albus TaxID=1247867 RepID=A0A1X7A7D2_9RHOB|nr:AAA family ATPase [Roseovarius albus]SLN70805.1 chromosome segregation protein [Roseovarius albus]
MYSRLQSLVIENFRSIRGKVVIPLDAQVVLIHGSNGMGKTSILSALELGLTGRIGHLAEDGDGYRKYLTNFGSDSGNIELTLAKNISNNIGTGGRVKFSESAFAAEPLLEPDHARFFSERCFLPQSALGRLLEIYDDKGATTNSPLTLFVKELLGLDPLDALVDGLRPAFHIGRLRNLTPSYRRIEELKASLVSELEVTDEKIRHFEAEMTILKTSLTEEIAVILPGKTIDFDGVEARNELKNSVEISRDDHSALQKVHKQRSELRSAHENWSEIRDANTSEDLSNLESRAVSSTAAFLDWSNTQGKQLDLIIEEMKSTFPDILTSDHGPERSRAFAEERAYSELARCESLLRKAEDAENIVMKLNSTIERASAKLRELDENLRAGVSEVQAFAKSLAGVTPHISDDNCPVCDRSFAEMNQGSLAAHVAAKIGALTTEAGRLQAVAEERATEFQTLTTAERGLLSAEQERISQSEMEILRIQKTVMHRFWEKLKSMQPEMQKGAALMDQASAARALFRSVQKNNELASALISEIWELVDGVSDVSPSDRTDLDKALSNAMEMIEKRVAEVETSNAIKVSCLRSLTSYDDLATELTRAQGKAAKLSGQVERVDSALGKVTEIREDAKKVSNAANTVRSGIVKRVFSESLNTLWRDLFLRLAPSEQFVPAFKLPTDSKGNVEAILETLHRSGTVSGSPGAILSQGNLNTAALTLFLALHLSVPLKQPWLVLDDPVQSMDDVHITQMAALLRTLSKGMNRQIVVAVHERALFDYLTLELSPSFQGDSLITVEISKSFEGNTVVSAQTYGFEKDPAIAA